ILTPSLAFCDMGNGGTYIHPAGWSREVRRRPPSLEQAVIRHVANHGRREHLSRRSGREAACQRSQHLKGHRKTQWQACEAAEPLQAGVIVYSYYHGVVGPFVESCMHNDAMVEGILDWDRQDAGVVAATYISTSS